MTYIPQRLMARVVGVPKTNESIVDAHTHMCGLRRSGRSSLPGGSWLSSRQKPDQPQRQCCRSSSSKKQLCAFACSRGAGWGTMPTHMCRKVSFYVIIWGYLVAIWWPMAEWWEGAMVVEFDRWRGGCFDLKVFHFVFFFHTFILLIFKYGWSVRMWFELYLKLFFFLWFTDLLFEIFCSLANKKKQILSLISKNVRRYLRKIYTS